MSPLGYCPIWRVIRYRPAVDLLFREKVREQLWRQIIRTDDSSVWIFRGLEVLLADQPLCYVQSSICD